MWSIGGIFFRGCRKNRGGVFFVPLFSFILLTQVQSGLGNVMAAFVIDLPGWIFWCIGAVASVRYFLLFVYFFWHDLELIRVSTACALSEHHLRGRDATRRAGQWEWGY